MRVGGLDVHELAVMSWVRSSVAKVCAWKQSLFLYLDEPTFVLRVMEGARCGYLAL